MTLDTAGQRFKMGVIIPSPNTTVEYDFTVMRPPGVSFHYGRMLVSQPSAADNQSFEQLVEQVRVTTDTAVREVATTEPDHMVMGMSAETFGGGRAVNDDFVARVSALSGGLSVTTGAGACEEAARILGVKKIALLTPFQPVADEHARAYFTEVGLDVVRVMGLKCSSATAIGKVTEEELRQVLLDLNGSDIDGIVQIGTNLPMLRLADEAERWLDKPVIAINAATLWHALRTCGFADQMQGFGTLLREH